jgi:hypothetical protein
MSEIRAATTAQERSRGNWRRQNSGRLAKVSGLSYKQYIEHIYQQCPHRPRPAVVPPVPSPITTTLNKEEEQEKLSI